jgi:metal-responsive CopG/Arc/MetJ family transcriptional regulator
MKQELPLRYEELMRVRVPAALIDAIDRAVHRDLVSRSGYIRQAVIARLRADGVGIEETQAA